MQFGILVATVSVTSIVSTSPSDRSSSCMLRVVPTSGLPVSTAATDAMPLSCRCQSSDGSLWGPFCFLVALGCLQQTR